MQEKELPPIAGAIVFVDEQPSCLTFNENASEDWKDTVQSESGLELCSQQKSSQELQSFVQNFENDTIAEDSQYAFASHLLAGAVGCIVGASYSLFALLTLDVLLPNPSPFITGTVLVISGLGARYTTASLAAQTDGTGHVATSEK